MATLKVLLVPVFAFSVRLSIRLPHTESRRSQMNVPGLRVVCLFVTSKDLWRIAIQIDRW